MVLANRTTGASLLQQQGMLFMVERICNTAWSTHAWYLFSGTDILSADDVLVRVYRCFVEFLRQRVSDNILVASELSVYEAIRANPELRPQLLQFELSDVPSVLNDRIRLVEVGAKAELALRCYLHCLADKSTSKNETIIFALFPIVLQLVFL